MSLGEPRGRATILLVDDEGSLRSLAQRVLERAGHHVVAHASAAAALAWWDDGDQRETVALVLTDVVMPGMSGPEMARLMRTARPSLPVLLMSGNMVERASGADHPFPFLGKPFGPAELTARVRDLLEGRPGDAPPLPVERGTRQGS
jgi:DNA-binding response OmpR family regulator